MTRGARVVEGAGVVGPLLASKVRVPGRRREAVARPRLAARLGRTGRLTLVSAPAGFGKTTLLSQWLASDGGRAVAWVSLDERDNDPGTFWTYVVTALQDATEGAGAGALETLRAPQPPVEAALVDLVNDLHAVPGEVVLVLDDYHLVESREIHDGMAFLVEHVPDQVHVVLATRADPPLPVARLRARGELVEIRASDLRFTRDEAAAYLAGPMGLTLSPDDVATLADRTEGWAAALQLAGLSLQDRDDPGAAVARFAGDDRFVVDYLADEVLARLPTDVRDFLLRTSVLERFTGPLCDAVTGQSGGAARLVALDRSNLFLVPLDERRQWYRYHHLFADVLRAHLLDQQPGQVAELHRRASAWFQDNGDPTAAIRHALAGADYDRAAELIEITMPLIRRERREVELARWVREVPDEVVRRRPVLAVAFVGALAQVSDFATVDRRLSELERALRPDGGPWPERPPPGLVVADEDGYRALPASVDMYRAALALAHGELDATVAHARAALSLAPPGDDLVRAAAGALGGLASWATGDLAGAHAAYAESVAGLARAGLVADVLGCSITLGDIRITQGRLGDALTTYQKALDLAAPEAGAPLRATADMHVGIAGVLVERDDLAAAAEHVATSRRLGEHKGLPQNPYRERLVLARLREADGDLDAALELLDEADRVYHGDYSPNVRPVPAVRARLRLRRHELTHADAWARERQVSADDDLTYLREYEHVTLARLLLARGADDLDDATGLLDRLLAAAEDGGRGGTVIEVLLLQALARQVLGDPAAALGPLGRAVALAEPEGYVRLFADEGAPMVALLRLLAKDAHAPRAYVRRLLAATAGRPESAPSVQALVDPLSDRELDVLRLLASDLDGPDIARELTVSLNTLRTHTKRIYAKLGVTSRRAAVQRGQALHLLPGRR